MGSYTTGINTPWAKHPFIKEMVRKGHTLIQGGGDVDIFVTDHGEHNGPGCSVCGWTVCWHCVSCNPEVIPLCSNQKEVEHE